MIIEQGFAGRIVSTSDEFRKNKLHLPNFQVFITLREPYLGYDLSSRMTSTKNIIGEIIPYTSEIIIHIDFGGIWMHHGMSGLMYIFKRVLLIHFNIRVTLGTFWVFLVIHHILHGQFHQSIGRDVGRLISFLNMRIRMKREIRQTSFSSSKTFMMKTISNSTVMDSLCVPNCSCQ